jgi:hypothetical protein
MILYVAAINRIRQGKLLFGIENNAVGPFLYYQILSVGAIGFGLTLYYLYRSHKQDEETIGGMFFAVAALHLCCLYCDLLFRMDSFEGVVRLLVCYAVFVLCVTLAGIVLSLVLYKKGEKEKKGDFLIKS